jgi:hypothetical protein
MIAVDTFMALNGQGAWFWRAETISPEKALKPPRPRQSDEVEDDE